MKLEADALGKDYEGGVHAVRDVSLAATDGESIALIGPSGSGKSTLLNLLGGLEAPSSGVVLVDAKPLSLFRPLERFRAERIGFVFQFHHLLPQLSLRENVELPMIPLGINFRKRRNRALEIMARLGLENRAEFHPARVSGGERQRCAVARALVNSPDLLLADEPTGNLDSAAGRQVMDILLEWIREASATLIVATHDFDMAQCADRRIRLRDGCIIANEENAAKGRLGMSIKL